MAKLARKRSREQWRGLVRDWRLSGETCREAAARLGVQASTLAWWSWRLGQTAAGPGFVEVTSAVGPGLEASTGVAVEVGELRVRLEAGFDGETLGRLLDVLEGRR